MKKGVIFNIQRYSVHDGPGIRTTVFLKGCPLNCWWCHNPESQSGKFQIMYDREKCADCRKCEINCPEQAVNFVDNERVIMEEKCVLCKKCIENCPNNVLELVGETYNIDDLVKEIEKDIIFFDQSGGGVTISGGEPLAQFDFMLNLIKELKERELSVAVDTCGYTDWSKLVKIADLVDIFLFDLKQMDQKLHQKYTGVSNELILENLKKLSEIHNNIIIRVPVIPDINNSEDNIIQIGKTMKQLGLRRVNLLPYHKIAVNKYVKLGMEYKMGDAEDLDDKSMENLVAILENMNLQVKIGG